ncbi:MAG: autotransporter domain-containing protein [Deltaproteobacteria bacterium]|nr:autotransporter domain-containing protein [Deltaproteobacteria bacterium]
MSENTQAYEATKSLSNELIIHGNNFTISNKIVGGYALTSYESDKPSDATTSGNKVTVYNLTNTSGLYGGIAYVQVSGDAIAENNTVVLSGYTGEEVIGGRVLNVDGNGNLKSNDNTVTIKENSKIMGSVFASEIFDYSGTSSKSEVIKNTLTIENSSLISSNSKIFVSGGTVDLSTLINANHETTIGNNKVEIKNSTIQSHVFGGYIFTVNETTQTPKTIQITNNSVEITNGSKIQGSVFGGFNNIGSNLGENSVYALTGNSVTLNGATVDGIVSGGDTYLNVDSERVTGNKVIFAGGNNVVALVQAGGDLYFSGGINEIKGESVNFVPMSEYQTIFYAQTQAENLIISGGKTSVGGATVVYDNFTVTDGEATFVSLTVGTNDNLDADNFSVSKGTVNVNEALVLKQLNSPTIRVENGGQLTLNAADIVAENQDGFLPVNLVVANGGGVSLKNKSSADFGKAEVNGTLTLQASNVTFKDEAVLNLSGVGLVMKEGSSLSGVKTLTIKEGSLASLSGSDITGFSEGFNVDVSGSLFLLAEGQTKANLIGVTNLAAKENSEIKLNGSSLWAQNFTVNGARVTVEAKSEVVVAKETSLEGAAKLNLGGGSTFNAGASLSLSKGAQITLTDALTKLTATDSIALKDNDSFMSIGDGAWAETKALDIADGARVLLEGSGTHKLTAIALNVKKGGELHTQGASEILGVVTVNDGGALNVDGTLGVSTLTVNGGGLVNLGTGTLTSQNNVTFEGLSGLAITLEGPAHGSITSTSGTIDITGQVELKLDYGNVALETITNLTLFSANGVTGFENLTLAQSDSFLFNLSQDPSGNVVINYRGVENLIDQMADENAFNMTPNFVSANALIQAIESDRLSAALSATIRSSLQDIHENLGPAEAEVAFKQLIGESLLEVTNAASNVALKTLGAVYDRLDNVRAVSGRATPAAGEADGLNRIWVGGFANWASQTNRDDVPGYKFSGTGVALGYDRRIDSVPGLTLGASIAFSSGQFKSNVGYTTVDIDTYGIGAYVGYAHQSGLFVDASINYARSVNDATVYFTNGPKKESRFNIDTWQFAARFGYEFLIDNWSIAPSLGLRYLTFSQDAFLERVTGNVPANFMAKKTDDLLEIPFLVKISGNFNAGSATVTPELRLGYAYAAIRPNNVSKVGFVGYEGQTLLRGIQHQRNSFQAGLGLKVQTQGLLDYSINYDLNAAKGFTDHRGSMAIGFNF